MLAVQLPVRSGLCHVRRDCFSKKGPPLIAFPRKHFDSDVRELVQVKVVHGSWKKEDMNGIRIDVCGNALIFLLRLLRYW